jgi:hypothetical protein
MESSRDFLLETARRDATFRAWLIAQINIAIGAKEHDVTPKEDGLYTDTAKECKHI